MEKIQLEFFEDYHNNKLSREAIRKFENELTVNQSLSDDYQDFLSIKETVERHEYNRLKQKLKIKIQENKAKKTVNRISVIRPIYRYRYITALGAILLIAFIPLYQNFVYPQLIYQHFALHEQPETRMSASVTNVVNIKNNRTLYNEALKTWEEGNYEQAIEAFRLIKNNTTYEPLALYNIALIQVQLKDKTQAKQTLQELIDLSYSNYLKPKAEALQKQLDKSKISFLFGRSKI